jgi:type II secretory pathway pseudopilin PulG
MTSPLLSLSTLLLLSIPALAQVGTILDHSKLPNCAFSCQTLLNAQSACVPSGGAPTTDQATYQSCFCQSAYLVQFKSTAFDICNGGCSTQELQQIQSWYSGLCNAGVVVTPGGGAAQTSSGASSSTTGATAVSTATSGASTTSNKSSSNQSWIATHYGWVIMVIVLILAAAAGIWLGLWLKRRHRRKEAEKHRDTTLVAEEAAAALRDRHPSTPTMVQVPNSRQGFNKEMMGGAVTPPVDIAAARGDTGRGKGRTRANDDEIRVISGGPQSAFEADSPPKRSGSRLKRRESSRRSGSRRNRL